MTETCCNGHPLDDDNLYVYPDGRKYYCRRCKRERYKVGSTMWDDPASINPMQR